MSEQFRPSFLIGLEDELKKIHHLSSEYYSNKLKVWLYLPLFEKILSSEKQNIIEAYTSELSFDFINSIGNSSLEGFTPKDLERIECVLNSLNTLPFIKSSIPQLEKTICKVSEWNKKLNDVLNGNENNCSEKNLLIPLLESYNYDKAFFGLLETITVKINKSKDSDNFLIVPSEKELEQMLEEQIKVSWQNAKEYAKKFVDKTDQYYDIMIHFNKRTGFCRGNSLGAALTIKFIEELLGYYNAKYLVQSVDGIAISGGLSEDGKILSVGSEIIRRKTELVFFSDVTHFVVPKQDESAARSKLNELLTIYPQRNLKIVAVEDLEDLLSRRNIVSITKQNPVVRARNFVRKNIYTTLIIILLTAIFTALLTVDLDNNPALVTMDGQNAYIKNKNGKVLWQIYYPYDTKYFLDQRNNDSFFKVLDVNNDGSNEVIYVKSRFKEGFILDEVGAIWCVDKNQNLLWEYKFLDTVYSEREDLSPIYSLYIIDSVTYKGEKVLFFRANNASSFSSAISGLTIKSGKRISETFWGSGHTAAVLLRDIDQDGIKEIIGFGLDNGYEDAVLWISKLNDFDGYRLTKQEYIIKGKKEANLISYLRIPKNDFERWAGFRTPGAEPNSLYFKDDIKMFSFTIVNYKTIEANPSSRIHMAIYYLDTNYIISDVVISNNFRVFRDSLVAQGKLNPPYTDTKEYKEILINNVLYWKDGKWLRKEEFLK
ncbi:Hypothetical protein IALB_0324 [Ignavibacterium album JCM 16511]|uniref:Lon proteolytic domain-containing protein n=1 Tax=Ignavibacterium album (strain DSM 19864 / JCM 16511 / NBRC 101810 / Mat9-16) TaxID=945713 RepID=I0AGC9_IGNAJ|nr:hypothetical protein [Ignavibacterium album]AFH48036.1 Hypothetical protein IALB_0324 [Ignavibacterium album JCM 16511]